MADIAPINISWTDNAFQIVHNKFEILGQVLYFLEFYKLKFSTEILAFCDTNVFELSNWVQRNNYKCFYDANSSSLYR
jgi:hypothetical protein